MLIYGEHLSGGRCAANYGVGGEGSVEGRKGVGAAAVAAAATTTSRHVLAHHLGSHTWYTRSIIRIDSTEISVLVCKNNTTDTILVWYERQQQISV